MDLVSFGETVFVSLRVRVDAAYSEPFSSVIGREINFSLVWLHSFDKLLSWTLIKQVHRFCSQCKKLLLIFAIESLGHILQFFVHVHWLAPSVKHKFVITALIKPVPHRWKWCFIIKIIWTDTSTSTGPDRDSLRTNGEVVPVNPPASLAYVVVRCVKVYRLIGMIDAVEWDERLCPLRFPCHECGMIRHLFLYGRQWLVQVSGWGPQGGSLSRWEVNLARVARVLVPFRDQSVEGDTRWSSYRIVDVGRAPVSRSVSWRRRWLLMNVGCTHIYYQIYLCPPRI